MISSIGVSALTTDGFGVIMTFAVKGRNT